ncbi:hypothetical protein F4604DRAFT_1734703 [Suillus subluteus]|nr:hypothetical protein F4604DRAFT_1734703 [Suillus subluteus]
MIAHSCLAVDFLTKILTFDPKKRITGEEALAHPYLEAYLHYRSTRSSSNLTDDISREQR